MKGGSSLPILKEAKKQAALCSVAVSLDLVQTDPVSTNTLGTGGRYGQNGAHDLLIHDHTHPEQAPSVSVSLSQSFQRGVDKRPFD